MAEGILLLCLLLYSIIGSQYLYYWLAFSKVQHNLGAAMYIELRNKTDVVIGGRLRLTFYATLVVLIAWLLMNLQQADGIYFITGLIALCMLIIDIVIALKYNIPLNQEMQTWDTAHFPSDWMVTRRLWFYYFRWRQLAGIAGLLSLLAGAVFGR